MAHLNILTRAEIESLGPPTPEEIADTDVATAFLCDLTLKHVATLPEPTTTNVADRLHLPRSLTEELLYHLYGEVGRAQGSITLRIREKLLTVRVP